MKSKNIVVGQRVEVKKLMGEDETHNIKVGAMGTITSLVNDCVGDDRCRITYDGTTIESKRVMLCEQLRKAPAIVEVPTIKVGDRVICIREAACDSNYGIRDNAVGTVLEVHEEYYSDGATAIVKWDKLEQPKYSNQRHMYCAGTQTQLAVLKPIDGSTVEGTKVYVQSDAIDCLNDVRYQGKVGVIEDQGTNVVGIRFPEGYRGFEFKYVSEIVEIPNEI